MNRVLGFKQLPWFLAGPLSCNTGDRKLLGQQWDCLLSPRTALFSLYDAQYIQLQRAPSVSKKRFVLLLCTIHLLMVEGFAEGLLSNLSIVYLSPTYLILWFYSSRCYPYQQNGTPSNDNCFTEVLGVQSNHSMLDFWETFFFFSLSTRKKESILILLGTFISDTCKCHRNSWQNYFLFLAHNLCKVILKLIIDWKTLWVLLLFLTCNSLRLYKSNGRNQQDGENIWKFTLVWQELDG